MAGVRRAAARVERVELELAQARRDYWRALADANASGVSLATLADELGVSRERVRQMVGQARGA
ncbi:MAG TPA: hypothetical protein VFA84_05385 [Acidimicrobiales bacterium]|nr:hypothetical protein [Acidimicrobiales bacterium]